MVDSDPQDEKQLSDSELNPLENESQNTPQQQVTNPADFNKQGPQNQFSQSAGSKLAKKARSEAWKKIKNKGLQYAEKKGSKWAAKKLAKAGAKKAITGAATAAGAPAGGVGGVVTGAAAEAAMNTATFVGKQARDFVKNPGSIFTKPEEFVDAGIKKAQSWGLKIGILIMSLFIFLLLFMTMFGAPTDWADEEGLFKKQTKAAENTLTIRQDGPTTAKNGDILSYTVTISYHNPFSDIKLTNKLPIGTQYDSATQKVKCNNGDCNEASRTIYWSAEENNLISDRLDTSFTLRLRATNVPNNSKLANIITGAVVPLPTPTTQVTQPTDDGTVPKTPQE